MGPIGYLYSRLKFDWTEQEYTVFGAVSAGLYSLTTAVILPILSSGLKIHDGIIGVMGGLSGMTCNIIVALAAQSWYFYLGKDSAH